MKLATLCYVKRDGRTLMMHRIKQAGDMHLGKWNGLGGKFKPGETPEACAIREVREESGLLVTRPRLKGFITFPAFDTVEDWYVFLFLCREFSGTLAENHEGYLKWISDGELPNLELWAGDRFFMQWFDEPGVFSARFVYANYQLVSHEVVWYR